jgi:hypothetical protein
MSRKEKRATMGFTVEITYRNGFKSARFIADVTTEREARQKFEDQRAALFERQKPAIDELPVEVRFVRVTRSWPLTGSRRRDRLAATSQTAAATPSVPNGPLQAGGAPLPPLSRSDAPAQPEPSEDSRD